MDNYVSIKFLSLPINVSFARSVVAAFCVQYDPSIEVLNDIRTSVSEAVTNCIVHGYGDNEGYVKINAEVTDKILTVSIEDTGKGIEDLSKAMQDFYTTEQNERSGLGFTIMRSFMDDMKVESAPGEGTKVTLIKRLVNA